MSITLVRRGSRSTTRRAGRSLWLSLRLSARGRSLRAGRRGKGGGACDYGTEPLVACSSVASSVSRKALSSALASIVSGMGHPALVGAARQRANAPTRECEPASVAGLRPPERAPILVALRLPVRGPIEPERLAESFVGEDALGGAAPRMLPRNMYPATSKTIAPWVDAPVAMPPRP
jgi:hypothetical protein